MTAARRAIWPEATHRGYHSVSLLLKDGRILTGGGKDKTHFTGCEKNELRIYTPPYLRNNPTRPTITNITEPEHPGRQRELHHQLHRHAEGHARAWRWWRWAR